MGSCKWNPGFQAPHSSSASVLVQATPLGLLRSLPWCSRAAQRKSEVRCEADACYPGLFSSPYKEARQYRSLHFHVYIQGHFLSKSIAQSEYTIFMSWCILELKYIEGNKNNKALKEGQHRQEHNFMLSCCWSRIHLRLQRRSFLPEKSETNQPTNQPKNTELSDLNFA